jgi:hypothetical protein
MQWKHLTSLRAKKFKVCHSVGKVMASVFWDAKGVIHIEFMPQGTTINANAYCDTLQQLREASQEEIWTSVMRCDPSAWQCNITQHTSDTRVVAFVLLGTSGPSTL